MAEPQTDSTSSSSTQATHRIVAIVKSFFSQPFLWITSSFTIGIVLTLLFYPLFTPEIPLSSSLSLVPSSPSEATSSEGLSASTLAPSAPKEAVSPPISPPASHLTNEALLSMVLVLSIRDAARSGKSFEQELDLLCHLHEQETTIQELCSQLEDYAPGIEQTWELQQEFATIADMIVSAAQKDRPTESMWDSVTKFLFSWIQLRKIGKDALLLETTEGFVARAEEALRAGDISNAVAQVKSIREPSAREISAAWLERAQAWIDTHEYLDRLFYHFMRSADTPPSHPS